MHAAWDDIYMSCMSHNVQPPGLAFVVAKEIGAIAYASHITTIA